ncbi:MAG: UPF0182 family protein [Nanoarchaeota archaeon]|nr:UPF0182 family protein [Nanoarchaeota archaeon]
MLLKTKRFMVNLIVIITLVIIFSISTIVGLYTDYLWFKALNFSSIFLISLKAKIMIFVAAAVIFFIFAAINIWITGSKNTIKLKLLLISVFSIFIGLVYSSQWFLFLQYFNQIPFNLQDPIFLKDVSFYVFSLPFYLAVWRFAMAVVIITIVLVALDYFSSFIINAFKPPKPDDMVQPLKSQFQSFKPKRKSLIHLAILASLAFFLLSIKHYLSRFSIMYSEQGIVVGAGYTDVVVFLPMVKIFMVLAVIVALLFFVWIFYFSKKFKKRHILLYILMLYFIFYFVGGTIVPNIVQSLKVSPNEINLEKPYIENNIKFTRIAYGLDKVEEKDFDVNENLTADTVEKEKETIGNVRILDYRPLTKTYKQTQEIRLYYDLSGIDVDRYDINGKYTQVMLAPRELNQGQIAENAKTWVNLHMVYTHGFGVVMSPVNSVTKEGLPNYLIKDIPPVVEEDNLKIDQPRVYYGEQDNDFVLVNTKTKEFDFPKGSTNEYIHYDGKGGVQLDSFMKKLLMAIRFADIKILLSSDITPQSKIMFQRNIQQRISKLTPFLLLDHDPYLVIDDGRLYWIQDAYTVTGNFPYSQKFKGINYMRNSVKVVMDAYNGDVSYYVADSNDPLMNVYAKIFPNQFKQFKAMPFKEHIRYPEDLFKVQSEIFSTYHMDDPTVFYNKEDAWEIPYEIYGTGQKTKVEPYYLIMKLPSENTEEFVLMTTFTPLRKDNMISWLAARSDKENYGKLLLFKFPKDKLVYGPLQIEAKIDQDSEISQQLTLWSQQGSRVTRGNLLVIPIKNNILYIEPLYMQAEQGQLPQLKRVIVSDGERVVMEEDLALALEALFGKTKRVKQPVSGESSNEELIQEAKLFYDSILDSMINKDWSGIGENLDNLGDVLNRLE